MQTFDMALYELYKEGRITIEEAMKNADSANNLKIRIQQTTGFESKSEVELSIKEDTPPEDKDAQQAEEEQEDPGMMMGTFVSN